jgi:hypothetical protein
MQDTAVYTADVIRGIGVLVEKLKGLGGLDWGFALEMGNKFSILGLLNALGQILKVQQYRNLPIMRTLSLYRINLSSAPR